MELFITSNKKENITFVKKSPIKVWSLATQPISEIRSQNRLLETIPLNGVGWILQIPSGDGHQDFRVSTNQPRMGLLGDNYNQIPIRTQCEQHYVEFRDLSETNILFEWFNFCRTNTLKKNMTLQLYSRNGRALESYHLIGCQPTSIGMDEYDGITPITFDIDHFRQF
jgi:hypothetical protein